MSNVWVISQHEGTPGDSEGNYGQWRTLQLRFKDCIGLMLENCHTS